MKVLVIHGPNLSMLGEREKDPRGKTLADLDAMIQERAEQYGWEVQISQSNHEGVILDALQAARGWADAVIINPGALAHTSYVLRDCIEALRIPTIEVHLTDIRRRESWRRKSVIKEVCAGQVLGKGLDSYLIAMQRFATKDPAGRRRVNRAQKANGTKAGRAAAVGAAAAPRAATPLKVAPLATRSAGTLATKPAAALAAKPAAALATRPAAAVVIKTLGPSPARSAVAEPPRAEKTLGRGPGRPGVPIPGVISRAVVRQKIADRLGGKLTSGALVSWARTQWLEVQRGAPAESGHRELLEDTLQQLVLSTLPATKLSDEQLVELMAQLDG